MDRPDIDLTEKPPRRNCPITSSGAEVLEESETPDHDAKDNLISQGRGVTLMKLAFGQGALANEPGSMKKREGGSPDGGETDDLIRKRKRERDRTFGELLTIKRAGQSFNEMKRKGAEEGDDSKRKRKRGLKKNEAQKRKRVGQSFNEMKKRVEGSKLAARKRAGQLVKRAEDDPAQETRRKKEEIADEVTDATDEDSDDYDDDIDYSKYWSDYDTWGYDKRSLKKRQFRKRAERLLKRANKIRKRDEEAQRSKKAQEEFEPYLQNSLENEPMDDSPSNFWPENYDDFGSKKRGLGSMKKKRFSNDKYSK